MKDETVLVVEWRRVPMETKMEKLIEYEYMFAFFKLLDICVTILIVIFMFQ
jgi:hypothetical protein